MKESYFTKENVAEHRRIKMSLSMMIYMIGFTETASLVFGRLIGLGAFGSLILTVVYFIAKSEILEEERVLLPNLNALRKVAYVIFAVGMFFHLVIPTKQTMVMIAAAEVGQRILASEQASIVGNRAVQILDPATNLLKIYIEKELVKQKKELSDFLNNDQKKADNNKDSNAALKDAAIAAAKEAARQAVESALKR